VIRLFFESRREAEKKLEITKNGKSGKQKQRRINKDRQDIQDKAECKQLKAFTVDGAD